MVAVKTGYGYITDGNGHILAKAKYPLGTVQIPVGDTYTEVADEASLEAIQVNVPLKTPQEQQNDLNTLALQELIKNQIASNPKLAAQQAAITESLNSSSKTIGTH